MNTDFSQKVCLGRTGLSVSRIGVGSSYGVSAKSCREAFDAGINYFFWGSTRTREMGIALRELGNRERESLVVAIQSYARLPSLLRRSVEKALSALQLDYADILILGWYEDPPSERILEEAARLREKGRFRFLGLTSHRRTLFTELLRDNRIDIFQIRYNAAHRGAEAEVFSHLDPREGPGVISFTNTRWGDLLQPQMMPPDEVPMSAGDCYRFVLSHPNVHLALSGPRNGAEMREAIGILEAGPCSEQELARFRRIGDHVHTRFSLSNILT